MPGREFANQKAHVDYAERKGLVFVWAFCSRQISTRLWMCAHLVACGEQCFSQSRSCKQSLRLTRQCASVWRSSESSCGRSGVASARRPRSRVTVAPRSFLDAGTAVLPGDRKSLDYAFPPLHTPTDVVTNTGGRVGWHRSPLPGPLFPGPGPW
jgi:hypothetical protein